MGGVLLRAGPVDVQLQILMEILHLESAAFIQYRPESEWAGTEFQLTEVPRDRAWFAASLPSMRTFWESWKELAARPDVRDMLVRKRAVPAQVDPKEAARALAKQPCGFVRVRLQAVGDDEVGEGLVGEAAAAAEEGVPLLAAVVEEAAVQVP